MSRTRSSDAAWFAAVAVITAFAAFVRLRVIADWPLWFDESATWRTAQADWAAFLTWRHHFEHAPLSFMLVRLATTVAGSDAEWVLRLPSALAGVAAVVVGALLGRVVVNRWLGLGFATLLAVDPTLVEQARQARMYSLLVLLVLLALLQLATILRRDEPTRRDWTVLGLLLGAGFWTHALGLALWPAIPVGLWAARRLAGALRAYAVAGLVAAPGIVRTVTRLASRSGPGDADGGGLEELKESAMAIASHVHHFYPGLVSGLLWIGLGAAGLVALRRRSAPFAVTWAVLAAVTVLAVQLAMGDKVFGAARYLIPLHLCVAFGIAALAACAPARWVRRVAAVAIGGLALSLVPRVTSPVVPFGHLNGQLIRALSEVPNTDEVFLFYRPHTRRLGEYYGVAEYEGIGGYESIQQAPLASEPPTLGADFDAPATWLVVGHTSAGDDGLIARLDLLAGHYGVGYRADEIWSAIQVHGTIAIRFSPDGVQYARP